MTIINSLPLCEGKITRSRMCEDKLEESILDVYVVCQRVLPYVTRMIVDIDKKYILTNYNSLREGGKATNTDHVPVIMHVNLMFSAKKVERIELFNFKDENAQSLFYKNTSETNEFMRQIFNVQRSCPIPLLYLEGGQIPARFLIQKQKLIYLYDMLQRDNESLLYKFLKAQEENPVKGDWTIEMKDLLKNLNLKWSFDDIQKLKKTEFKNIITVAINKSAMAYLKGKIKTKGKEILYSEYPEIQDYLLPYDSLTLELKKKMFKFRTRMNVIPANFSSTNLDLMCETPCNEIITNEHIYECKILNKKEQNENDIKFNKIFNGTINEKIKVINIMNEKYEK